MKQVDPWRDPERARRIARETDGVTCLATLSENRGLHSYLCRMACGRTLHDKGRDFILLTGPWMTVANLANILWLYAWLFEYIGLSFVLMLIILVSLMIQVVRLNMERWDAPFPIIVFVWWPICIYSGWIAVATIANASSLLVSLEWQALLSAEGWAILMILAAVALNLLMILLRNMREFAAVGVWALVAISLRHWDSIPGIQWTSLAGAIVLSLATGVHGFRNRATGVHIKFRQYYGT